MTTPRFLLLVSSTLLLGATSARADVVIFKDGFMLYGKVSRDGDTITDPGGAAFTVPKGPFFILDGARRVYFSHSHVASANNKNVFEGTDLVQSSRRISRLNALPLPPLLDIRKVSRFNDRWERTYQIGYTIGGRQYQSDIDQRLTQITPQFARVDALKYAWTAFYQTSELGPELVQTTLLYHPDFALKGDKGDLARKFRMYRFLMQAGWFDLAEAELDGIAKDFPKEKDKVAEARTRFQKLRAIQQLDEIERGARAGRHRWVQQQLAEIRRDLLDDALAAKVRTLAEKYEMLNNQLKDTRRLLKELPGMLTIAEQKAFLTEAADTISPDLNLDTVDRLETFGKLALDAENARAAKRMPINTPEQLLCVAASGWVVGKDASDAKFEVADRLWRTRQFLETYLKTEGSGARGQLLRDFLSKKADVQLDDLATIVRTLPPPDADKEIKPGVLERTVKHVRRRGGLNYLVQLPEEYTPARSYPLVIALAHATETAKDALDRCSQQATRFGCILIAPDWTGGSTKRYRYRADEHAAVTEVLRDARRRYQIDSDKVCLIGFGEGATMAYDVGLSHPGLFAGVVPVSADAAYFTRAYLGNAQYLPFYVVHGSLAGDYSKHNMQQAEKMVTLNYPIVQVVYKGRGQEFFDVELPTAFDWMSRKTRLGAFPLLGGRPEDPPGVTSPFVSMRETDNRFYWIGIDSIEANRVNDADGWRQTITGAMVNARIGEGNQINITTKGVGKLTLWLGRDAAGREMIDFSKPINVRWNGSVALRNAKATPDIATYLEDLFQRGDRQHVVLAKVELGK